uniref:Uncharacterized protein n=1 Tax=Ananas comosus var. bracteatus TaxID=296719 RepID=A0A6V7QMP7_ANACO|nr:unnamed protein product [Ananas comosus var. bracteatus]
MPRTASHHALPPLPPHIANTRHFHSPLLRGTSRMEETLQVPSPLGRDLETSFCELRQALQRLEENQSGNPEANIKVLLLPLFGAWESVFSKLEKGGELQEEDLGGRTLSHISLSHIWLAKREEWLNLQRSILSEVAGAL